MNSSVFWLYSLRWEILLDFTGTFDAKTDTQCAWYYFPANRRYQHSHRRCHSGAVWPGGGRKPGIIDSEGQLRDLSGYVSEITPETLSSASLDAIAQLSLDDLPSVAGEPRLGVPLTGIGKIIAIGFNYINHAAEMEVQLPAEPLTFMKATSALTGPFDQIIQPRNGLKLDYEAELVVVIGSRAQYISEEDVFDHIAGYTVGHDVSERAFQRERGGQFTKGKSADTFAPVGPYFVSADQIKGHSGGVHLVRGQRRNATAGEHRRHGLWRQRNCQSSESVHDALSGRYTNGTPAGVGDGMDPPQCLKPGDVVRIGVEGLGEQRQVIAPPR